MPKTAVAYMLQICTLKQRITRDFKQQLITSEIKSYIEHLIQTYNIFSFYTKIEEKSSYPDGFNTI